MKTTKSIVAAVCAALCCSAQLFGQGVTTLICQGTQSNGVQIASSQTARIKSYWDGVFAHPNGGSASYLMIQSGTHVATIQASDYLAGAAAYPDGLTIAGPATIALIGTGGSTVNTNAILTLDIEPGPYPPGKAVTIGAYSGNVQVTMQMSTDLVNWAPAVNSQVYSNSPTAAFFRIVLVTNPSP